MPDPSDDDGQRHFGSGRRHEGAGERDGRADPAIAQIGRPWQLRAARGYGGRGAVSSGHDNERKGERPHWPAAMYMPKR